MSGGKALHREYQLLFREPNLWALPVKVFTESGGEGRGLLAPPFAARLSSFKGGVLHRKMQSGCLFNQGVATRWQGEIST